MNFVFTYSIFKDELAICQRLKTSLEAESHRAEERISRFTQEKKELQSLLEEEKQKVLTVEKDLAVLKDTMTMMDEQLQV